MSDPLAGETGPNDDVEDGVALVDLRGREHESDVESLVLLASGSSASAKRAMGRYRAGEWILIGWEEDLRIVGCVGVARDDEERLELHSLAVSVDRQGRGIGRALIEALAETANARCLLAETDADGVGFYRACGFVLEPAPKRRGRARFRIGTSLLP